MNDLYELREIFGKKTTVATELAYDPRTAGEVWGHSDAWDEEIDYLVSSKSEKDAIEYAQYMRERFEWVSVQLRKQRNYTPDHRFSCQTIQRLFNDFDVLFPEKIRKPVNHAKKQILKSYDEMTKAMQIGGCYHSRLNPPPADDSMRHEYEAETGSDYRRNGKHRKR